ncbi:MAG: ATP-binding protein [Candidatus Iainarchaeum archaeon]|uniref:ATP-binding protein n=1 Tax=Candidatus Iainarchaeum sp. TaxID=3101447 RepID=A0A7T9DIU0_9ARCH|nr:MAG: ATP-binding protein [Candidatus Diapherotrites archaeon]
MAEENPSPNEGRVRKIKGHKDPFEAALEDTSTQSGAPLILDLGETPPEEDETALQGRMASRARRRQAAEDDDGDEDGDDDDGEGDDEEEPPIPDDEEPDDDEEGNPEDGLDDIQDGDNPDEVTPSVDTRTRSRKTKAAPAAAEGEEAVEPESEWNEEHDLQDLLHEEGVTEEGIDSIDELHPGMEEDAAANENPSDEPLPEDAAPRKRQLLHAKTLSPLHEKLKEQLLLKARAHEMPVTSPSVKLELLELPEKKQAFIGRKKSILQKSGLDGALYIGKVQDDEKYGDYSLYLDSLNPHVVFICGSRGSGKSYLLGVIAEELALHNKDVGVVVVDPVGVFWSMKFPNKEEREVKTLNDFNLMPQGLENLRVFIPEGSKNETPKNTYDGLFSIPPAMLTSEDWALTFGMERFSPTGLLLEKALKKVETGFKTIEGEKVPGKKNKFSLDDLILCLEKDFELNSRERGYKPDSVRALVSRFEAAKAWGIFSEKGTPLSEISREGQLTVIDTSFLDDSVTALVIGILARRLLAARKVQTRREAAQKFKSDEADDLLETEIPPTWLFIDEAHTLIPSGNVKTPATNAIVEYVKQGRRPGCSLVFATQQPSAIDTRVLSQLDVIVAHKLIFDDDIKAIMKRTPTIIPMKYKHPNFLKTLPVGIGLTGDRREETSRAFVLKVRPRMSQHEGRDAETGEHKQQLSEKEVMKLAIEVIFSKLEKEGKLEKEEVEQLVQTLNSKYRSKIMLSDVLDGLEEKGARIDAKTMEVISPTYIEVKIPVPAEKEATAKTPQQKAQELQKLIEEPQAEEEETSLRALPVSFSNAQIIQKLEKAAKKSMFGFGGTQEKLQEVSLHYKPIYHVEYRQFTGKTTFIQRSCDVDAEKGEFVHYLNNQFVLSNGLSEVGSLSKQEGQLLHTIARKSTTIPQLASQLDMSEKDVKRALTKLYDQKLIDVTGSKEKPVVQLSKSLDLPFSGSEKALSSLAPLKLVHVPKIKPIRARISADELNALLSTLWPNTNIMHVSEIYQPVIEATLMNAKTNEFRKVLLDGFTGNILEE